MRLLLACGVLCGCTAYQPGSFRAPDQAFLGQHRTVGCLDVGIAERMAIPRAVVLDYTFGNRCDRAATVDLAAVQVVGRTFDGREVPMFAHDPNREIRPLPLDGRATGHEAIAYEAEKSRIAQVCLDAGAIAHASSQWVCFAQRPAVAEVTP